MAYNEQHGRVFCHPTTPDGWRGVGCLDLVNHQRLNKVVVAYQGPDDRAPEFEVLLYSSNRAAEPTPYYDDELHLIMPPLTSKTGQVVFFDTTGYAFQDRDRHHGEVFGKLRVVINAKGGTDFPIFLVAVGGDVPGGISNSASVCV